MRFRYLLCRSPAPRRPSARTGDVPAPRGSTGTSSSRAIVERGAHVVLVARHHDADRHDLVDRRVGRVAAARRGVEQHVASACSREAPRELRRVDGALSAAVDSDGRSQRGVHRRAGSAWTGSSCTVDYARRRWLRTMAVNDSRGADSSMHRQATRCSNSTTTPAAAISCRFPARPTCPTACCARSTMPTIDHRGPGVRARSTLEILDGLKQVFQTDGAGRHLSRRPAPARGKRRSSTRCRPAIAC